MRRKLKPLGLFISALIALSAFFETSSARAERNDKQIYDALVVNEYALPTNPPFSLYRKD